MLYVFIIMLLRIGIVRAFSHVGICRSTTSRLFSEKRKAERVKQWQKKRPGDTTGTVIGEQTQPMAAMEEGLLGGLVIERQGDRLLVELASSQQSNPNDYILCSQKSSLASATIVVGDHIYLRRIAGSTDEGVAVGYKDRRNLLERPVASNPNAMQFKQIASNIDQMFIVTCCVPLVPLITIDRYLVIAHLHGVNATIILNKNDLEGSEEFAKYLEHYPSLGYRVLKVSNTGEGLPELMEALANKTSIFCGQSGVGKSSLINMILPDENIRTGGLTQKIQMGSHTTSNARLYHLACGGDLIDSPGIREYGLWHLDERDIQEGFKEIFEVMPTLVLI